MDDGVVNTERATESIEFGSIIANRYTILRPENVAASTFTCRDAQSDALRSVWAFKPGHALDPNGEKFLLELTKVQSLEHPQLRKLLDFGREASVSYAVYEPLELRNLADVLDQDWPLTDERIVWLICQLLSALEVAHAVGLTHGDLRPENILVRAAGSVSQNEEILLCGLGLATSARYAFTQRSTRPQLQLPEWIVGTPHYAAPEQLRGEVYDARSDVYSAGVLLFQLLTRAQPFDAANDADTAYMQCYTPPPPPSGYGRVSPALEAICLKALTKTPDVRYQTANEMRAALLASQAQRSSRLSMRPSRRPSKTPPRLPARESVPAEVVVATRLSQPAAALVRADAITTAPIETPVPPKPEPATRRGPSATVLLSFCALAIAAAMILPDLPDLRESGLEDETTALSDLQDGLAKHVPANAPNSARVAAQQPPAAAEPVSQPLAAAPAIEIPGVSITAAAAQLPAAPEAKPAAPAAPAAPAVTPAAPAPAVAAAPARAPRPRVRVHAVDNTVVAADSSVEGSAAAQPQIAVDISTGLEPSAVAAAQVEPTPAVVEPLPAEVVPQPMAAETAAKLALPMEREQVVAPVPEPVTAPPPPRPIVLTNVPRSAGSEPTSTIAQEVEVAIGDANMTHGAVSKAGLRSAFNQAALARCYRESVNSGESSGRAMTAQLTIETNATGRIISAKVDGQGLPSSLVRCLETAARLGRVREADTGEVRATVGLRLQVR